MTLSDGVQEQVGIIAAPLNHYFENGKLKKFTIVTISDYVCNEINGRNFIIVVELQIEAQENKLVKGAVDVQRNLQSQVSFTILCFIFIYRSHSACMLRRREVLKSQRDQARCRNYQLVYPNLL